MERSECHGCFDPDSDSLFGSCEGCMGIVDFQMKCYNILKKTIIDNENGDILLKMIDNEEKHFLSILFNKKGKRT